MFKRPQLKFADGHPGDLLELPGKVLGAAVMQQISNFTKGELGVAQQLFDAFDFKVNQIFFDGGMFVLREQFAKVVIAKAEFFR